MAAPLPSLTPAPFAFWPAVTLAVLVLPVVAGLAGTVLPAFGYLPAIGAREVGFGAWRALAEVPALMASARLGLFVAVASTLAAFALACAFVAATTARPGARRLRRLVSPLLAAPHVGVAIGLAFLLAPSGILVRLVSPALTGWTLPPFFAFPGDPWGLALILGLVVKETPFLVLVLLAAQAGRPVERELLVARTLGHGPVQAWFLAVLPQLYPTLRLPLFAVLAYGFSPVDMALVLGPSVPPILAVRVVELLGDPDLARWPVGAAAALLLLALSLATMALWRLAERPVARLGRARLVAGPSGRPRAWLALPAIVLPGTLGALGLLGLATMPLWSVAGRWRFPDAWPASWTGASWADAPALLGAPLVTTVGLALVVALAAVALVLLCLEAETHRASPPRPRAQLWLFLPLLVPQAAFLFGVQVLLAAARIDGTLAAVALVHLSFVVPYVFLALAGSFRALDARWALIGRTLGHRPWTVLWRVKLPLVAAPAATAFAVAVAVSVALYLPTLFAGGGRVRTLVLEAVALATSDRRSAGVVVTLLAAVPLAGFIAAAWVRRRVEART